MHVWGAVSPGFGTPPEFLAGRDLIRRDLRDRFERGEVVQRALYGERGVGKTVLLEDFRAYVAQRHGWPIVSHQVIDGEPLTEAVAFKLIPVARELLGRKRRVLDAVTKDLTIGVEAVVKVSKTITKPDTAPTRVSLAVENALVQLGEQAAAKRKGILILVDEIQAGNDPRDLAGFSRAIQSANRAGLPIHLLTAGLSETVIARHLVGRTRGTTFLERLAKIRIDNLTPDSVRAAFLAPVNARGVTFDFDALEAVVSAAGGYPYFVQLIGARVWEATAGTTPITRAHVDAGLAAATETIDEFFKGRLARLSPLARDLVTVMARLEPDGRPVAIGAIASELGRTTKDLSLVRTTLINDHQLVAPGPDRGELVFTLPHWARWLSAQTKSGARGLPSPSILISRERPLALPPPTPR